jgi:catechol 2,3-dioxygenase-like lactoylglutathione lyase family enzyme
MPGIGRLAVLALDCPDHRGLAAFYSALTGLPVRTDDDDDGWIELVNDGPTLAFQRVDDYVAPSWPGSDRPQQAHVDVHVTDLDEADAAVLALGATKADYQPGTTFRVFLDPAGHPFCLVLDHSMR